MLEVLLAIIVFTMAAGAVTTTIAQAFSLGRSSEESGTAMDACLSTLEDLRAEPVFEEVFLRYNANLLDNPVAGLSPGDDFAAGPLLPLPSDPDAFVGSIQFPGDGIQLLENVFDPELGMPRDLNGDGAIDAIDHWDDYQILPVRVRVAWVGKGGRQRVDLVTTLSRK
jgi:hypothetical protein